MGIVNYYRRVDTQRQEIIKEDLRLSGKTSLMLQLPRHYKKRRGKSPDYFTFHALIVNTFWGLLSQISRMNNKILSVPIVLQDRYEEKGRDLKENSLMRALKPVLVFGKIIGVIPVLPKFRIYGLIVILILCANVCVEGIAMVVIGRKIKTPFELAASIGGISFYFNGVFIYVYLYRHYGKLLLILQNWTDLRTEFPVPIFYVFATSILIFTSAIAENIVFSFKLCPVDGDSYDFWNCTYQRMHGAWAGVVPAYHSYTSIFLFMSNKFSLYAWNFTDVLIIGLSLGLYSQFNAISSQKPSPDLWPRLRDEYDRALEKLAAVEEFLSPLIFATYGINMYAMCMQLNLWLTPSKNITILDSVYSIWSSLHLAARVGLMSYTAAKVNEAATDVLILTRDCPSSLYTLDIYRLEITIQSAHVGLSGLKCFFITKRFLLSIVSVVFTFEVVLLQNFQGC